MTDFNKDSLICAKCGSNNSEGSLFCSNCGATLTKEEVVNEVPVREEAYTKNEYSSSTSYTDSELSLFLEKNQPYYMEKFKTMEKTASSVIKYKRMILTNFVYLCTQISVS